MRLDKNNLKEVEKFNKFTNDSKYGTFVQDMRWASIKNNRDSVYFYIEEDGEIVASLSILYIEDKKVGRKFFYAPKGPVCDLYDIQNVKALIEEASEFVKEEDGFLLRIDPHVRFNEDIINLYKENGLIFRYDEKTSSQPLLNMVLDIDGRDIDQIMASFSKNTRKHIRKSYREDIYTKVGTKENLKDFYEQVVVTSNRAGIDHRPYEYFERLYDAFEDQIRLSLTYFNDELLCSSLMICYGDRCTSLYGGSSDTYKDMNQNYQINYEEIKYAADNGFKYYDMGGIFEEDESDGLYQFKKKFTDDNVEKLIGELDIVFDETVYEDYIQIKNPHYRRIENGSN